LIDAKESFKNQDGDKIVYYGGDTINNTFTFKKFICQYIACCTGTHQLVYTFSSTGVLPIVQSKIFNQPI
jgi:hypothetical protein